MGPSSINAPGKNICNLLEDLLSLAGGDAEFPWIFDIWGMDRSENPNMEDQPTGPGNSSTSAVTGIYREQMAYYNNLRDEHKRLEPSQVAHPVHSRATSDFGNVSSSLEGGSKTRERFSNPALIAPRPQVHQRRREVDFDAQDQAISTGPYQSPRLETRRTLPRAPNNSPYDPDAAPFSTPYNFPSPPPSEPYPATLPLPSEPSHSTRKKNRGRKTRNERPSRFSDYEYYTQYRQTPGTENYRPGTYVDGRPAPDRYAMPEGFQHGARFQDPRLLLDDDDDDVYRQRKFWDTYDTDPNISRYRSKELQKRDRDKEPAWTSPGDQIRNDNQIRIVRRDRDEDDFPQFPLVDAAYSSQRPTAVPPAKVQPFPDPYYHDQDVSLHNTGSLEGDTDSSSSEDEAWTDMGETEFSYDLSKQADTLLNQMDTPPAIQLRSKTQTDEDLLNPSYWSRKVSVVECAVKESHNNRASWPDSWRHSDNKTCPKALGNVWPHILDVDRCISRLDLDAAVPVIDNSKWRSKRRGNLAEVVAAYKTKSIHGDENTGCAPSSPSSPTLETASWDSTCEQVQRLLKVRDYLICVCRDAEYLNDLHPTMDAITWFERAQNVNRAARREVVELMSVKISQLSEIIESLNSILQAILWGWSEKSTICIQSDQETAGEGEQDGPNRKSKERQLENTRSRTKASKMYANGERRIRICIQTLELGLETVIDEVEVFAAILSQALLYQCEVLISDDNTHGEVANYGRKQFPGLFFAPRGLECLGGLIQNRNVWVLEQFLNEMESYPYVSPAITYPNVHLSRTLSYVRTTIVDLARIWGPIWQASELSEGKLWLWYRLPGGYIGAPAQQRLEVAPQMDEAPCHFSSSLDGTFDKCPSSQFFVPSLPYLLIGHGLPTALLHRELCPTSFETGLGGLALQTIGTLKPFRYVDATAFNITVGHAGTQASWNTQIKVNPGILMKQSLLDRWKLEPKFRNPRLLLLWYGLEVSCCTRNARRCRLVDLVRSRSMIEYLSAIYRPETGLKDYKMSLFEALNSSNADAFVELYDNHPEWQGELGTVVARCLEVLKESGVDRKGDLAAFAFMEKFHDPEQLAILPRKDHTWIPMLKDSFDSATFAFMSHHCLGYPRNTGQKCRLKDRAERGSKSILETNFTSTNRSDMIGLFKRMDVYHRLTMRDQSRFSIKKLSSKGILLGTWRGAFWRYLHIPSTSAERFREKRQDGERAIRVFVASSRRCKLARLREPPVVTLMIDEDDVVSGHTHPKNNVVLDQPLPQRDQTAGNPPPGDRMRAASADQVLQRNSRSSTMTNASTLRGDDASLRRPKSEASTSKQEPLFQELDQLRTDASTQTEPALVKPILTTTPSPTQNGEFLLPTPRSPGSDAWSSSAHLSRSRSGSHEETNGRSSRNGHSRSGSHGESNGRSSGHGHRHRRSHGDSEVRERISKDESLASKLGFR